MPISCQHTTLSITEDSNNNVLKDTSFNFDLVRMQKAVDATAHRVPPNLSTEEFIKWMKSKRTEG